MAIKKFEKLVIGKVEHQQSQVGAIYPIGIIPYIIWLQCARKSLGALVTAGILTQHIWGGAWGSAFPAISPDTLKATDPQMTLCIASSQTSSCRFYKQKIVYLLGSKACVQVASERPAKVYNLIRKAIIHRGKRSSQHWVSKQEGDGAWGWGVRKQFQKAREGSNGQKS